MIGSNSLALLGLPLLAVATPALATGGFDCRTTDDSNSRLSGTIGHTIVSPMVGARLQIGERVLSTTEEDAPIAVGRSWIDAEEIRVDLVDANAMWFEAELRARIDARGTASGTLERDGTSHAVRCVIG